MGCPWKWRVEAENEDSNNPGNREGSSWQNDEVDSVLCIQDVNGTTIPFQLLGCRYRDCVFAGGILDFGFCSEEGKKEEAVEAKKFAKTIARQLVPGETELTGNHKEMLGQWQAERAPQRWKTAGESQQKKKSWFFVPFFCFVAVKQEAKEKGAKKGARPETRVAHGIEFGSSCSGADRRKGERERESEIGFILCCYLPRTLFHDERCI